MPTVNIPKQLLMTLFKYFLIEPTEEDHKAIRKGLEDKLDAMIKHELYTTYKTAETEREREQARIEYLDKIGMHKDFRW